MFDPKDAAVDVGGTFARLGDVDYPILRSVIVKSTIGCGVGLHVDHCPAVMLWKDLLERDDVTLENGIPDVPSLRKIECVPCKAEPEGDAYGFEGRAIFLDRGRIALG